VGVKREPPAVRSATWSGAMTQPDPWLEHYGERRRRPRRPGRPGIALALAVPACVLVAAALVYAARDRPWQPPSGLGGFHDCTYGGRLAARCASLRVPVDAARPEGRAIELRVVVIPATRQPARGALFYLEGGPGGAASAAAVKVNEVFAKISEFRDLVLVDQRGTGGSHALVCPQEHVRATDAYAVSSYLRRCFARVGREARFLTTAAAADDLERMRRALGYGRIDVYGASYGATLAQVFLRRHPRSLRTVTLDGASLPGVAVYELEAGNAERALRRQIARCRKHAACRRAFPDTRAELARVLARRPQSAGVLATAIAVLLRSSEDAARVPLLVHAAALGDYQLLAREHAGHVGSELDARSRLAMFWTVLCGESWARFDVEATERSGSGSFLAEAAVARARMFHQACAAVPRAGEPPGDEAPLRSTVPVLLLAGGADPQDPPRNLRGWRDLFPNARLVTVPGLAHGVIGYGCLRLVVARFVANGSARGLDATCARSVPLPPFELS
jgi:pimeloyl-ACP methyl ester carboxylesterase